MSVGTRTEIIKVRYLAAAMRVFAQFARADIARWVTCDDGPIANVSSRYCSSPHHSAGANDDAWPEKAIGTNPGLIANGNRLLLQRKADPGVVMSAAAKVRTVRDRHALPDLN